MSKNLSAKYYHENKEKLQRKACKDIKIFLKKKKKKNQEYDSKRYKNLSEDEKNCLIKEINITQNEKKHFIITVRNICF